MSVRFLDRYESLGLLGQGSMGEVHATRRDGEPDAVYVVKIPLKKNGESKNLDLFAREIETMSRIRSPFVARLLESGVDRAYGPVMVMEYLHGLTLEEVFKREGRLHPDRAMRFLACMCRGLEEVHRAGYIHRDIKPANMIVVEYTRPGEYLKLMDFGLVQTTSKIHFSKEHLSTSDTVVAQGTPAYISPEQLRGDSIDGRADVYSIGVVLYEMLTGTHPFPFDSVDALIDAHLRQTPRRFAEIGIDDVPAELEAIVFSCLSKYTPERPSTPRVLAKSFDEALGTDYWEQTRPATELPTMMEVELGLVDNPTDPNAIQARFAIRTPEALAMRKIGGFLQDQKAQLLTSEPGNISALFAADVKPRMFGFLKSRSIEKPLLMTLAMTRTGTDSGAIDIAIDIGSEDRLPLSREDEVRCQRIVGDLKKYLMVAI
jgi:eukaryotic-like serine/threonine-protein kinase